MLPLTDWFLLAAVCAAGAMTPGLSLAVITRHTLTGGSRAGIAASLSHALGIGLWALATVTGMALLLRQYPRLETLFSVAGALFLLWLAINSWRASREPMSQTIDCDDSGAVHSAARDGFAVAFLNPKVGVFFLALFSQFLEADMPVSGKAQMVATATLIDGGWYCLLVAMLGRSRLPAWLRHHQHWVERATAALLGLVAVSVLAGVISRVFMHA